MDIICIGKLASYSQQYYIKITGEWPQKKDFTMNGISIQYYPLNANKSFVKIDYHFKNN